jgi:hypothetical protein
MEMIVWPDLVGLWLSWAAAARASSLGESEPQRPFGLRLRESATSPLTVSVPAPMVAYSHPANGCLGATRVNLWGSLLFPRRLSNDA